jgi:hypothetical protein
MSAAGWSGLPVATMAPSARSYKNIVDAAQWSRLPRPLNSASAKKTARASRVQDPWDDPWADEGMFDAFGPKTWKVCVKTCVGSAMQGAGTMCTVNCTACVLTASPWSCAICAGCGTVGFVAIEFCTLHCCVNPGCPASYENFN